MELGWKAGLDDPTGELAVRVFQKLRPIPEGDTPGEVGQLPLPHRAKIKAWLAPDENGKQRPDLERRLVGELLLGRLNDAIPVQRPVAEDRQDLKTERPQRQEPVDIAGVKGHRPHTISVGYM